jgi:hypothetical protein
LNFSIGVGALCARELFLDCLVGLAGDKVRQLLAEDGFIHDFRLFSHLIDETVLFEKEIGELYSYYADDDRRHHHRRSVTSELCRNKPALELWLRFFFNKFYYIEGTLGGS